MGMIKLEPPRCPRIDPNPDWTFSDLFSELNSLESKLNASPLNPKSFNKTASRDTPGIGWREKNKAFVMRVSDDDTDEDENESLVQVGRFVCPDFNLSESDESEDESMKQLQPSVKKFGVVEGALLEQTHEYELGVKEDIRNKLSVLETELVYKSENSASALLQVEKKTEARRERDRKLDMHYQRKIAEALDNHLTAIQRDHEHWSQMEERRIRDDAALEEAKRNEKALKKERLRQQKAKEEEEARREAAKRAEEERKSKQETERAAKEAADKIAREKLLNEATNAQRKSIGHTEDIPSTSHSVPSALSIQKMPENLKPTGNLIIAAENALKLEERRLQKYKELEDKNQLIICNSNMVDLRTKERAIGRLIKQISGSIDTVRSKENELVKIFKDPVFPQSVSIAMFARKVISFCETPNANTSVCAFACGHVIVYVSAQVPAVMDCLLAEFHKACIYTVPKHIQYFKSAYVTNEAYFKAIGYREEDGKIETTDQFLERLGSYMKLYGALVQTEVQGIQNIHGLEEAWNWLARFLNNLPANLYTAVALESFLRMAGFALHRKYKSQFTKILKAITSEFVHVLKERGDPKVNSVITRLQDYIGSNMFLREPEGRRLRDALLSSDCVPETDNRQQYSYTQNSHFHYQR